MLEFDASVIGCELPIGLRTMPSIERVPDKLSSPLFMNECCLHLARRSELLHGRDLKCVQAIVLTN